MAFDPVSLAITAGATYLGNKLEQKHVGNIKDDDIARMQALGLTPTEIAGAGGIGAGAGSGGAVLGNSAGQRALQAAAQAHEVRERDKDRAVALKGQQTGLAQTQIAAQASLGSSSMAANASRYGSDLRSAVDMARVEMDRMRLPGELANLSNQNVTSSPDFQRFMKMLSLSPQNVASANAALGLPFDPLDRAAVQAASPQQRADVLRLLIAMSSGSFREAVGLEEAAKDFGVRNIPVPTLGQPPTMPNPPSLPDPSTSSPSLGNGRPIQHY